MHKLNNSNTAYAQLPRLLLPWYSKNARDLPWRQSRAPYPVWVSEIMLQQTRVEAVRGYYARFLQAAPTIQALAEMPEEALLKLWEGLGYYSRARNMQKAARQILEIHDGVFPESYAAVRALPGIGDYTAGAVCSICFNMPSAAVDGNVLRIISRITGNDAPIDLPQTKKEIAEALEAVYPKDAGAFTQALMELGACICTPRAPKCDDCPVARICFAKQHNKTADLPVKLPKRAKRLENRTVFLFESDGTLAIEKRMEKGLLSGLWQFPNLSGALSPEDALAAAAKFGAHPVELLKETHKTHIFTHIRWEMTGYHILCHEQDPRFIWASRQELQSTYALPTAFRMFLEE